MKLAEVIAYSATIERLIAEVYASFAERWSQPPLGTVWRELATEERAHARMLDEVALLPETKRADPRADSAKKLQAIHDFVMTHYPLERLSLDEALAFALDLEDLEVEHIYRRLLAVTTGDYRISRTLRTAVAQDDQHVVRIAQAIRGCSNDRALQARARVFEKRVLQRGTAPPAPEHEK